MPNSAPETVYSSIVNAKDARHLWNWLLARQGLAEDAKIATAVEIAQAALGLHAARLQSPFATVLARASSPSVALDLFTSATRTNLMTVRCMRKTLHTLPPQLAASAHAATVHFRKRDALRAIENANVSFREIECTTDDLVRLLDGSGPLFHRHIEARLLNGRRAANVVRLALKLAWESGVLLYLNHANGWNREDRRFALTSQVYPGLDMKMDRNVAVAELIGTYFDIYGPASLRDAMWWFGLSRTAIVTGLGSSRKGVIELDTPWTKEPLYMFRDRFEEFRSDMPEKHRLREATLNFLAHEDVALKAYSESRDRYLAGTPGRTVFNQIGEALPTILVGGHAVGTWMWNPKKTRIEFSGIPGRMPSAVQKRVIHRADALSEAFRLGLAHQSSNNLPLDFSSNC